jgi:hypothetical protein
MVFKCFLYALVKGKLSMSQNSPKEDEQRVPLLDHREWEIVNCLSKEDPIVPGK